jgi:hypothetical protein
VTTIAVRYIAKPRRTRQCDFCRSIIVKDAVRLFGYADRHDPVAQLFYHNRCYRLSKQGYTADDLDVSNPHTQHERSEQ